MSSDSVAVPDSDRPRPHPIIRHLVGLVVLLCAALSAGADASAQRARPNVVLILADDLGAADLGAYGSRFYETPNLDGLAREGMRFTRAYAASPVCSPTRASILTGLYPARLRQTDWIPGRANRPDQRLLQVEDFNHLPLGTLTIAEALHGAGYVSGSIGKWHLGGAGSLPTDHGFALNIAGDNAGSPPGYFWPYRTSGRALDELAATGRPGEELTERQGEEAAKFIAANRDRPFFLYLPLFSVHTPLQARPERVAKYQEKAKRLGIAEAEAFGTESGHRFRRVQNHAVYAAMVETMDLAVGRVLRALRENGLDERTVVIFFSDNGGLATSEGWPTTNLPLRAGKGWLYEGGIREPLIVRWPGVVVPGSVYDRPVVSTDFFPTLTDLAGVRSRGRMPDGVSLLPALRGGTIRPRPLYWHYPHYSNQGGRPGGAMLEGDLKLIEFFEDGRLELYDLATDPGETVNLAERNPARAEAMRRKLQRWRSATRAEMPGRNPDYRGEPAPAP